MSGKPLTACIYRFCLLADLHCGKRALALWLEPHRDKTFEDISISPVTVVIVLSGRIRYRGGHVA